MDAVATCDEEPDQDINQQKSSSSVKFLNMENKQDSDHGDPSTSHLSDDPEADERDSPTIECTVCFQPANFPIQLPCKHTFCFLCAKGVAQHSRRCALCRQDIPADFLNDPKVVLPGDMRDKAGTIFDEGYQWFYEGRNGWWQYDDRTSLELEARYKKGEKVFEQLIAGYLYIIDLESMKQWRKHDQSRRRRIRRDLRNIPDVKGIAGLKFDDTQPTRPSGDGGETSQPTTTTNNNSVVNSQPLTTAHIIQLPHRVRNQDSGLVPPQDDTYLAPPAPNNTPQTPQTPADSPSISRSASQHDLTAHLQNLHISENSSQDLPGNVTVRAELSESEDENEACADDSLWHEDEIEALTESDYDSGETRL